MPTFSYSGDPTSSNKDEVRFLVGDVSSPWQSSDEEISYLLGKSSNQVYLASVQVCRRVANRLFGRGVIALDGLRIDYTVRANEWRQKAQALLSEGEQTGAAAGIPYAGGTSVSDNLLVSGDIDRPQSAYDALVYPP